MGADCTAAEMLRGKKCKKRLVSHLSLPAPYILLQVLVTQVCWIGVSGFEIQAWSRLESFSALTVLESLKLYNPLLGMLL